MRKQILSLLLSAGLAFPLIAQEGYRPSPQILEAREEFQDNKFGIFIHWGIYSMLADGEWVLNNKDINYEEYGKMAGGFYPASFDAREWVKAIKAAGAKYICFTTRHHDGFSMFDSQYSDFTITKATPFKRDIVKELADACHEEGINLHFYYSLIDWTRDDYVPLGNSGRGTGRPLKGQWKDYYAFMNNQLHELLTNYGEVNAIWFDGKWDQRDNPDFDWGFPGIYSRIHEAQPGCLIGNNHHEAHIAGEDIQIFERDLPGQNTAGFSEGQEVSLDLPLETCETMNGMWGYKITDQNYKSTKELIHYLVKAAGMNANLLMNIGPQPDGRLPQTALERLKEMGEWMSQYGETIYGTRGGLVSPHDWGVTTQKENRLFVHILNLKDKGLFLPIEGKKIKRAIRYKDQAKVRFKQEKEGVLLLLDEVPTDIDHVIELQF